MNDLRCMENLLSAFEQCGEAAAFYMGDRILMANGLFAELFGLTREECEDLPIMDICHEESIDRISDFIRRRAYGDHSIPTTYTSSFLAADKSKMKLQVTVLKTKHTEGAFLAIVEKTEEG
ncbi:MAG TPA: PAS domain-containing protein [Candidatus Krumholzibacterium sp.]|nr:PAS domain-containing protein [Candidatus Krumholzibacterium sp.]